MPEGILKEALVKITKETAQVISEDEDIKVSEVASTCRTILSSKASPHKRVACALLNARMKKLTTSACLTVLPAHSRNKAEMKKVFKEYNICATLKNKKSTKILLQIQKYRL